VETLIPVPPGEHVPTADQRLVTYNVPWEHFEVQLALRGDRPVPRMAYLRGVLELMRPSRGHERIKSLIGRLIEAYALERGVDLSPYGGWMLKHAPKESAAEPDECYIVGSDQSGDRPDLVIEVVWTSGGIDKLEIYRRLASARSGSGASGASACGCSVRIGTRRRSEACCSPASISSSSAR
jgi:Uma2 family endonuclease